MSSEAINETEFIREYTLELRNKNAAVFVGAGLSAASGYVDWKGLLKDIFDDLKLDPKKEEDLVTVAQYHCNQSAGNRSALTQKIMAEFGRIKSPTKNHQILASLPIQTYWTTNYDKLIEKALEEAKKVPDVKYSLDQLSVTKPDRDVIVYKMHGDADHSAETIINKDDYEAYPLKMGPFVAALKGDLVAKTFLFIGFSFSDPNIDYILSRVRAQYDKNQRMHYCVLKQVTKAAKEKATNFQYRQLKQEYFIRDLKRVGIKTVLVSEYSGITTLLEKVAASYRQYSVFISGSAEEYGKWNKDQAQEFLHDLSYAIAKAKNRVITGFGLGVGSAVINGTLALLDDEGKTISDEEIVMRPFPQVATGKMSLHDRWAEYRKAMIAYAGLAVFVFGNKKDKTDSIILAEGLKKEFDLCIKSNVIPIPIGATGYMAKELWKEVNGNIAKYFPNAKVSFISTKLKVLGDDTKTPTELISTVMELIQHLQKG